VQFYFWTASTLQTSKIQIDTGKVVELSQSQRDKINRLKPIFSKDDQLAETVLSCMMRESRHHILDWAKFTSAVSLWRDYALKLHEELVRSFPFWRTHQSIFEVQVNGA
jgi:leucine proline-enriched proteoglycan (leprecan)